MAAKKAPAKKASKKKAPAKKYQNRKPSKKAQDAIAAAKAGKMGRPTKYDPAMAEALPEMFANGESLAEVCVTLGIHHDTFHEWCRKYPNFSAAYKKGLEKSEAWWQRLGRAGAAGMARINPPTWIFNMKNRFGWKDKTETEHSGEIAVGGLSVPTPVMDADEWEKAAMRQQALLKGKGRGR